MIKNLTILTMICIPFIMGFISILSDFLKTGKWCSPSEELSQNFTVFILLGISLSITFLIVFLLNNETHKKDLDGNNKSI